MRVQALGTGVMALIAGLLMATPALGGADAAELAKAVSYELNRAKVVDEGAIVVRAEGGRVVLEGRVRSRELIDEAASVATGVDGVDQVDNRLKVTDTPPRGGGGGNSNLPQGKPADAVTPDQASQQADKQQKQQKQRGEQAVEKPSGKSARNPGRNAAPDGDQ